MPKGRVISLPSDDQWKGASFEDTDFNIDDPGLAYLIGFEEILPGDLKKAGKKTKASLKQKAAKSVDSEPVIKKKKSDESAKQLNGNEKSTDTETKPTSELIKKSKKSTDLPSVTKLSQKAMKKESTDATTTVAIDGEVKKKKKTKRGGQQLRQAKARKHNKMKEEEKEAKSVRFVDGVKTNCGEPIKIVTMDDSDDALTEDEEAADQFSEWKGLCLPDNLMSAVRSLNFKTPTSIQREALIPAIRDRLDILGAAETGSGKTLAFALPVLSRLMEEDRIGSGPRALVIAPTRELVMQIMKCIEALSEFMPFRAVSIVGGLAEVKQQRVMRETIPELLVATPGRLWELMKEAAEGDYLADFTGLQFIVVDEADRMMEQGHFKEVHDILAKAKGASEFEAAGKLQTFVFSATLTYVVPEKDGKSQKKELTTDEKIKMLMEATGMRAQNRVIDITRSYGTAEKLVEARINCSGLLDKDTHIMYLLKRYAGRTLIFTNSVDAARRLHGVMTLIGIQALMLHAGMIQRQRLRNIERFAAEDNSILIATDVAARGLDIKKVEHVFHYQVPRTAEGYIHRSGRTARGIESGLSIVMVDPKDAHLYRKMCANLNRSNDLPVFPIDMEELRDALETRVELASSLDNLRYKAKKISMNENWFEKMAREADLDLDDRERESTAANEEYTDLLNKQDHMQWKLKQELHHPLPNIHKMHLPKTRYITPEISSLYSTTISTHALDDLESNLDKVNTIKRKNRDAMKTHNIKGRKFKKKH